MHDLAQESDARMSTTDAQVRGKQLQPASMQIIRVPVRMSLHG